jgi:hypothetical protein
MHVEARRDWSDEGTIARRRAAAVPSEPRRHRDNAFKCWNPHHHYWSAPWRGAGGTDAAGAGGAVYAVYMTAGQTRALCRGRSSQHLGRRRRWVADAPASPRARRHPTSRSADGGQSHSSPTPLLDSPSPSSPGTPPLSRSTLCGRRLPRCSGPWMTAVVSKSAHRFGRSFRGLPRRVPILSLRNGFPDTTWRVYGC